MRRFLWIALLVVSVTAMVVAQTSMTQGMQNAPARKSPLAGYAGSWIGTFNGKAWITIRLTQQGTAMTGTLQRQNDVKFTDQGDIKSVGEELLVWLGAERGAERRWTDADGEGERDAADGPLSAAADRRAKRPS